VDAEISALHSALTRDLRVTLSPDDGLTAFERHQLLAIRFHHCALLNAPAAIKGEGDQWRLFFDTYFPHGGEHATLLWKDWRIGLLKDDAPGPGVVVSHLHPDAHWQLVLPDHRLFINLESMWDDYESSVVRFIAACDATPDLRSRALGRWREWSVETVAYVEPRRFSLGAASASGSFSNSSSTAYVRRRDK